MLEMIKNFCCCWDKNLNIKRIIYFENGIESNIKNRLSL